MNKIIINNDNIYLEESDNNLELNVSKKNKFLKVKNVKIKIKEDTDIIIECGEAIDTKLDININIAKNIRAKIYEIKENGNYKYQYTYNLEKNSQLEVEKIIDVESIHENTLINLNGENAKIDYKLKTISKNNEKYNFVVNHNAKKTISNIINNGVNIKEGKLEFNVSTFIPKGNIKCNASQSGRIINETKNKCIIKPNLFIDENDVIADHSALIGTFSKDEIFYLMSRGINKNKAQKLLARGLLLKNINYHKEKFNEIINKYWR